VQCYSPLSAFQPASGGRVYFADKKSNPSDKTLQLPCGQCIGCRLRKSAEWATRCVHEAQLHDENCFITLTYDEEHLPHDGSISKKHMQQFMKTLRKKLVEDYGSEKKVRFFGCGEYGDQLQRPHYHLALFGYRPDDLVLYTVREGVSLYTSDFLSARWGRGFVTVGELTFESAAYIARYVTKKIKVSEKSDPKYRYHYEKMDPYTGEIYEIQPEFVNMSRKPGIAAEWMRRYKSDVYPDDFITHQGRTLRPPRYYDKIYDEEDPKGLEIIKQKRLEKAHEKRADNTPERLKVKKTVTEAKMSIYSSRSYEK
jgi:hypothetical protein